MNINRVFSLLLAAFMLMSCCAGCGGGTDSGTKAGMNRQITDNNYDKSLAVKCINGTFVGRISDDVMEFKGIPFVAQQPVGKLRWKAPVEFEPDEGVYEAYYNGKSPFQEVHESEPASLYVQGEDCLYLNIWTADNNMNDKPVMVWIHGGAYQLGGTVDPMYNMHNLVAENPDIIAVTIGYRVGMFGFLHLSHLPDGADYPDAQNLGIMDQVMALKWVHDNIAAFGGDPDNVTIFGESAGADSVILIPLISGAENYAKRVIAQSGSPVISRTSEQSIECTGEFMKILNCKTVKDLQNVDVKELINASLSFGMRICPERDGVYIPADPYGEYANGAVKDIAILQGCNKDEMNYFVPVLGGAEEFKKSINERLARYMPQLTDTERAQVESFYNDAKAVSSDDYEPGCRLYDQIWFRAPLIRISENQAKAGGKSYTYYFTPESSIPDMKCCHAMELSTVLNNPENTIYTGRVLDETFAKTMRKMWIQFARTGDPSLSAENSPDGKAHNWPLYNPDDKELMVFDEFNIHTAKEAELKIVDWDRMYFITKYYLF